jgi:hypothetical protein
MCIKYDPHFTWCHCAGVSWAEKCKLSLDWESESECNDFQLLRHNIHTFCDTHARGKFITERKADKAGRREERARVRREWDAGRNPGDGSKRGSWRRLLR